MTMPLLSAQSGPQITVNSMMKSPTTIPRRILNMMDQAFLADALLRKGSNTDSGVVLYNESTPLFSDTEPKIVSEFGEIPTAGGLIGTPKAVRTVRRALGVLVSKTMRDRNNVDAINTQITQVRNTMIRAWDDAFISALVANTNVQTQAAAGYWDNSGSDADVIGDINQCKYLVNTAYSGTNTANRLGYHADTMVISDAAEKILLDSATWKDVYQGNLADKNIKYTGKLPNRVQGLDVLVSWRLSDLAPDTAIILQRKVVGFISDERPLSATPMYGVGGGPNGGPTETWRTDITRQSAVGIDQPKAAVILTGISN